ncbi:MAG: hypothetical protein WCJ64_14675, partial [Rhodospirillaceae bacterium]
MFDVFATILSAGVVISVVTLVVHEPLLLAAGISTILGLLFLLLPMFTTMVPVMGYLLIFTGIVSLGYGVLSTRSWLNVLHARRLQAMARRQALQAARAHDGEPPPLAAAAPVAARKRVDEDADDELPPRVAAQLDRDEEPRGKDAGTLSRFGRRLGRGEPEPEPDIKPAGKPWRNPYDPAPGATAERPEPPPTPAPPPPAPAPAPVIAAPPPRPAPEVRPAKPVKPLGRGAERIKRIKEESRQMLPARRPKPKPAAVIPPPPAVLEPPAPPPPPPAPSAPVQDESAQRARRQRDLMELDLL